MRQFTVDDLSKQVDDVTDAASHGPVVLTRDGKPSFVLMSFEHYSRLTAGCNPRSAHRTSEMPAEHVGIFGAEIASPDGIARKPGALRGRIKIIDDSDE